MVFSFCLQTTSPCYFLKIIGRSTLVGQRPMKSLSSVYQSVRLPLSFLKIRSLVFPDTVHDDSWPRYLVADKSRFLKKKIWRVEFWPNWSKSDRKWVFPYFIEFASYLFLEIGNKEVKYFAEVKLVKKHFGSLNLDQVDQNSVKN